MRSTLAVLAGIVTLTALAFGIEAVVAANEAFMYAYGTLSVVAGGWVTARLAPRAPLQHAIAMGALQALLTVLSMFGPEAHIVSVAQCVLIATLSFAAAVAGGALFVWRMQRAAGRGSI